MKGWVHITIALLAALTAAGAIGGGARAAERAGQPEQPEQHEQAEPPDPQPAGWQMLPPEIGGAFVSRDGSCFYLLNGDPAKEPTVSDDHKAPSVSDGHVVAPGYEPILLDRAGVLWCEAADGRLVAVDVDGGGWWAQEPTGDAVFRTYDAPGAGAPMRIAAHEDAAGRLWFGTSRGVEWRTSAPNGETEWHAKDLADPNGLDVGLPMTTLHIFEDDAGMLYFWAPRSADTVCGTRGFWTFDGNKWAHYTVQEGLPDDRLATVCPIGDDVVLVVTATARLVTFSTGPDNLAAEVERLVALLNDEEWAVREAATDSLVQLGRRVELPLEERLTRAEEPEVRSRIKMALDAMKGPAPPQPVPGAPYTCASARALLVPRRRPDEKPQWLVFATDLVDAESGEEQERAVFVLSHESMRLVADWPYRAVSVLSDGAGGLWIGVKGRGLVHWDGAEVTDVADESTRGYTEILGTDRLGRILVSNGSGVAVHAPETGDRGTVGQKPAISPQAERSMDDKE